MPMIHDNKKVKSIEKESETCGIMIDLVSSDHKRDNSFRIQP